MIIRGRDDLLEADVDALVNAVNTVGVMGKGLALQFKRAYPDNFLAYKEACASGGVVVGAVHVHRIPREGGPRFILNFPTKRHWRSSSRIEDIEVGLVSLRAEIVGLGIRSLAVPPLGCGHGGLDWEQVKPLIDDILVDLPGVEIRVWDPL